MNDDVRTGLLLPSMASAPGTRLSAREVLDVAARAEQLGFDSLWVGDSLSRARLEPLALLAAVSQVTERVTLGTAALLPALRQPVMAAQEIATLDELSGGRLVLGVGAGFPGRSEDDLGAVGVDPRTCYSLLDDIVALWRALWSDAPPASFHGKLLHYDWLPDIPPPRRPGGPPFWFAGATPAGLARAAQLDGWLPYPPSVEDYERGWSEVRSLATAAGRDPETVTPALFATAVVTDDVADGRRQLDDYCQAVYRAPAAVVETIQVMFVGSADAVADGIGRYVKAGARHILVRMGTLQHGEQLDQLASALPFR